MWYAYQSPRGIGSEYVVHRFGHRDARDRWVARHAQDGGVNAALCGAQAISEPEAIRRTWHGTWRPALEWSDTEAMECAVDGHDVHTPARR